MERRLRFQSRVLYEVPKEARQRDASKEGERLYAKQAGVEGTVSLGVQAFRLRRIRYGGLAKTHLQHLATVAAINLDRIVNWIHNIPRG